MNYRDLFDNAFSEAFENAPFSDEETFIKIVKERTKNMEKKNFKMKKPAVIAAVMAAAAVLTISVGAAVNYFHQQSVDIFFPDNSGNNSAVVIDEESPLSSANEHFRITLDKTYFDGDNLTCIMTAESLDGTPLPRISAYGCHDGHFFVGTYPLHYEMSTEFRGIDPRGKSTKPFIVHISENELKNRIHVRDFETLTGGTYIRFNIYDYPEPQTFSLNENGEYVMDAWENDDWNVLGGIEIYTEVEKNIDTTEVFNDSGEKLILTQIGYYSNEHSVLPFHTDKGSNEIIYDGLKLIMNDGTVKEYDPMQVYAAWSTYTCYALFPELIQLDDYVGIEINGVRYMK